MKIGIVVHSKTGNTYGVAEKIKDALIKNGHSVTLEKVTAINEEPSEPQKIQLSVIPKTDIYDALIFGAPVRGFSLSPVMDAYLMQISTLKGKKICCFMTQSFPFPWMGGNRSLKRMKALCEAKNGNVFESGIINWMNKKRENMITDTVKKFSLFFK
jgi:flavodoxin